MKDDLLCSEHFLEMLQALGHVNRLRLVACLRSGEMDVQSLQKKLSLGQSTVSQHLAILRNRKLVSERRAGRHVYYKLTLTNLTDWLLNGATLTAALGRESVVKEISPIAHDGVVA
ncbi:MAG: ArsR/SmtB family transcription factor, partial [Gemmataceae bacterium]